MYQDILIPNLGAQAVEKVLQDTLHKNEELFCTNREMLIDFYFSQQTDKDEYQRDYFNIETNPDKDPDYPHNLILSQLNITAKLIDKKSKNYIKQPIRKVDGKPSKGYDELLLGLGIKTHSKLMDRLTWLLGDHCIVVIADKQTKKLRIDQPPYYRPFFMNGNMIDPVGVMYPSGLVRNNRGEMVESWTYWDEKDYVLFEHKTWNIIKREPNPHGVFNAIFTHRMKPFRGHWTRDAQDLVDTNRDVNITLTSLNNAIRYHGFPIMAAIGIDAARVKDVKIRFDKILCVSPPDIGGERQTLDLKMLAPSTDWAAMMQTIKTRVELLASTWNVDIRWDISGDLASGVALKILSIDNRDDLNEMAELYEEFFEAPLFEKIKTISTKIEWLKPINGTKLTLDWQEEPFIESPQERSQRLQTNINFNLTNPIDELKAENPDLTDEEAARQYIRNRNINALGKKTELSVEDIVKALEADELEISEIIKPEKPEENLENVQP